jgi:hypothetical protein
MKKMKKMRNEKWKEWWWMLSFLNEMKKKNIRRWCVNVIYQIISLQSRVLNQHHQK